MEIPLVLDGKTAKYVESVQGVESQAQIEYDDIDKYDGNFMYTDFVRFRD